ncbi:MAG TPA: 3'(2'),5'-bisphosphate nucleotidase CysQ [Caulobacterales bacterium]|nr:3'(2'),5'-bisphosphate nucleotidase CysQ [Caulobacterales bacterium]
MSTRPALEDLIKLAVEAGRAIMAVRDEGCEATNKSDGSPVTIADQRAEAIIEAGLKRLAPDAPMVGEEAVAEGRIPDTGARFYCVDPLDGTRDFIAGETGEFTVNIALVENRTPVVGVVFAPATGELYAGEPGRALRGSFDGRSGELRTPIGPIHAGAKPQGPWRVIASRRSGKNAATDAFITALGESERLSSSSSIKFCRLAEGAADLYPRFGDVNEWDIAAGHAILSAAGGGVMLLDGAPLAYGGREGSFLVHGFIAFASAAAAGAARKALAG